MAQPVMQPCATCLYAMAQDGMPYAECHRRAPSGATLPRGQGPEPVTTWPLVDPTHDGCGEGDPKP